MITVLIADDEAPARAKVRRFLGGDTRFTVVGEAVDGVEALERIETLAPDLVILDVQMPGLTGFELLDALGPGGAPQIIFSTAFDRYALAAFDAAAVDYLLKPYDAARFGRALDRAAAALARGEPRPEIPGAPLERLLVKDGDGWRAVRLADVWRLEAEDKHVRVHAPGGPHLVRQSLRSLQARLDARRFVRVHRGEIVALDAVTRLEPWSHGDALLILRDGATVVLSRSFRDAFVARFGRQG